MESHSFTIDKFQLYARQVSSGQARRIDLREGTMNTPTSHVSIYGRYIGRVGALAAALGIGVMVVTAPGVATADPSSSTGDTSSSSSDAAGASSCSD